MTWLHSKLVLIGCLIAFAAGHQAWAGTIIIDRAAWLGCEENTGPCVIKGSNPCKIGCEFESTKRAMRHVCDGRQSCQFDVTNEWFAANDPQRGYADPAGGHRKMLQLSWTCHGEGSHYRGYSEGATTQEISC